MAREIGTVGVIGLGIMGAGIVEVFARAGLPVTALEIDEAALERGRDALRRSTGRAVAKGKLTEDAARELLDRITFTTDYDTLAAVDLVVEAAPERLSIKQQVFAELDRVCRPDTVLATNTSSLSVTEIAHGTRRPERVLGVHFFNPAPVMKLVEVIHTVSTDPAALAALQELCGRLGKVAVTVSDRAGFVVNYLLLGYLNQAAWLYQDGYASREDLDDALRLGAGFPMGPLTLMDLIGIDTMYEILEILYADGGNRRHAPAPILRQLATAGMLGRKTGRGFYRYEKAGSGTLVPDPLTPAPTAPPAGTVRSIGVLGADETAAAEGWHLAGVRVVRADPTDLSGLSNVDLVVSTEDDRDTAVERFGTLAKVTRPDAVLAVNSSVVPVIDCAMATGRPEQVVGLHLVGAVAEVVRTVRSEAAAVDLARAAAARLDRRAVVCGDRAGLVVDALLTPYLNDAIGMLAAGYADADGIDHAMTLGCGYPTGPIALADQLGLAEVLATQRAVHREYREPGLAPAPLLSRLVTAGRGLRAG